MELRHLRYFRAVAEELHFGRAAQRLHIAQPPLSQQIRQLEEELGVSLFTRSTRRVELTRAGAAYLAKTIAILDAVEEAGAQATRVDSGVEGHLAVGCVGSATYSLLPQFIRALRNALPAVDLRVRGEMLAPSQLIALHNGEIDIGLLRPPVVDPALVTETVRRDRLLVALPSGHPLTDRRRLAIADLRDEDFVGHAGGGRSRMAELVTTLCGAAQFTPRVRHQVDETSTLVTLVAAGLGVAVVPEPTAALGITGVCFRPLSPSSTTVDLIAVHRGNSASPLILNALAVLRDEARRAGSSPPSRHA